MAIQLVIIGPEERQIIHEIVKHSEKPGNWYDPNAPGWLMRVPGHNPKNKCILGTHRCVFSYTVDHKLGRVFRHLSVSVPQKGRAPNPIAIKLIANEFGFTGLPEAIDNSLEFPNTWAIHSHFDHPVDDPCIVIAEDTGIEVYTFSEKI